MGTCHCEFDRCSEYIFNQLTNQCPQDNAGPTCALMSYLDNSDDIEELFQGTPAPDAPVDPDVLEMYRILDKLVDTNYKVTEIITGVAPNTTTVAPPGPPPPAGPAPTPAPTAAPTTMPATTAAARRKRSYVPLECYQIVHVLEDINDLLDYALTEKIFRGSTIVRNCDYILVAPVTNSDCSADDLTLLQTEATKFSTNIASLRQKLQDEVIPEAATEMEKRNVSLTNYTDSLKIKEMANTALFLERQAQEEDTLERAIAGRTVVPPTLAPFCRCPQSNRHKRAVTTTMDPTTIVPTTTGGANDSGNETTTNPTTATTGPPTTTWPLTCICPEDEEVTEVANVTDTNSTSTNSSAVDNTTESGTQAPSQAPTTILDLATTVAPAEKRRRRSLDEIEASLLEDDDDKMDRMKRSIRYRCNTTITLGLMFYDMYNKRGMLADRCCCPNYRGELFNFFATLDQPWTNSLSDIRSSIYKDWKKMVDQEVRFLLLNKKYSALMVDNLMGSIEFLGFKKTPKGKVGVEFEILMNKPHWDNDDKIEKAFEQLIYIYRNQSTSDKTVLGRGVLGRYTKRDYLVHHAPNTHRARRYLSKIIKYIMAGFF
jgi:hypothetical protein